MTRSLLGQALLLVLLCLGQEFLQAQNRSSAELPQAPLPQQISALVPRDSAYLDTGPAAGIQIAQDQQEGASPGVPPAAQPAPAAIPATPSPAALPGTSAGCSSSSSSLADGRMSCNPGVPFARLLKYSGPFSLTTKEKFLLAWRDFSSPFSLLTIGGEAAITIGSDADTAYGPGLRGYAKYAGASATQNMAGEFFGTFLIPSLAGQDPRYHRVPNLSMRQRTAHVFEAVVVAQGDDGRPMFNYANVFGTIAVSALGNAYLPGRDTSWGASTARVSVALATSPIGYAIAEFLPDVARHININVVLVQRVINRIALAQGTGSQ